MSSSAHAAHEQALAGLGKARVHQDMPTAHHGMSWADQTDVGVSKVSFLTAQAELATEEHMLGFVSLFTHVLRAQVWND